VASNPAANRSELSASEKPKSASGASATAPGAAGAHQAAGPVRPPFDPIKENGPIFVGWPRPQVALVITGRQDGYLEPCGCAGLDRMKGGMSRRYTLVRTLREHGWPLPERGSVEQALANPGKDQGWPLVLLDVGGLAKGFGPQAEQKFQIAVDAIRDTGCTAIGLGAADLQLPPELVLALIAPVNNKVGPFLSANVALFEFDETVLAQSRVVTIGGKRLGITAVLGQQLPNGKKLQDRINNPAVKMLDPAEALAKVLPALRQKADYLILLAYADEKETFELAERFPQLDLVATAGGPAEPPAEARVLKNGRTRLVEIGEKGMQAIVVGLFDDQRQPFRYQRVTLDSRFAPAPSMVALMAAYQSRLQELGLSGLNIHPVAHPLAATNGRYVGTDQCQKCHEPSYKVWKNSPHATSFAALVAANPPRQFDPECISCHVVGWHPTKFFPYQSGYLSEQQTPRLRNTGCEDCHGPGEAHAAAELGTDRARQKAARKAVAISKAEASDPTSKKQNCYSCHDLDNSPDFNFKTYFPRIEHHEQPADEK
jgi:hypothetical protein